MPDFKRGNDASGPVGMKRRSVPAQLCQSLARFARDERTTEPIVLLAATCALLHRYTGQTDLLIGSPVEGRSNVATELMVGMFVDTLPLRIQCRGEGPSGLVA